MLSIASSMLPCCAALCDQPLGAELSSIECFMQTQRSPSVVQHVWPLVSPAIGISGRMCCFHHLRPRQGIRPSRPQETPIPPVRHQRQSRGPCAPPSAAAAAALQPHENFPSLFPTHTVWLGISWSLSSNKLVTRLHAGADAAADAKQRLLSQITGTERGATATSLQRGHIAEAQVCSLSAVRFARHEFAR